MDGVSVAASIVAIASAGVQISIKLITFASQVKTAQKTINAIGNDVSLTSGVLQELGELMKKKKPNQEVSIFSEGALRITQSSARICQGIFDEIETELGKATKQLTGKSSADGDNIELSKAERMKWPFLQPGIDGLRAELEKSKGTLMLVLQVTTLGYTEALAKANKPANITADEKEYLIRTVEALGTQFYAQKGLQAGNPGPHNPLLPQGIAPDEAASSDGKELQNKPSSSASYQGSRPAFLTSNTLVGLGAWSSQVCNPQGHSQQESDNTSKQALASLDARTPIDIASTINLASQDGTSMRKENTQRVISAQQSDDHQAATETKQTNLPPAGTTSTQLSFREHGRKQSADCDIVPPPKGVAGSFTQTRDQLLQTESLPRHLEAVQNQSQVSTGPPSDAVGISIANKGFFARSRYRWFRRDKRQIEPKYDERVVEGAQLETWNINPTVRLTESGFKRFLVVSFIALEDKEILQYLLSDRQNSKSTVWQRYKALSAEERDALDDDILSRRARRHGHTGDAVLLSIRFGTMEPLQRKYDPIKGRSIRVILRINQNPTDEEENARATGSDFPAEPLDDLLDLSVLLSRAPMRGSALALPINWPRIRAGLADKEPPQLDLDDLLRGLGKTSLGAWESVPLRPASVHMEVMDGLEYNPFRNARRMRSKVPSGSRMTTLSVEDSMRDRLSLEAGPRSEDSQDMTIFSGIALSTLDVSGGEMIAMPSVDAPSVAGAKDVVSELLAEFTTLYD